MATRVPKLSIQPTPSTGLQFGAQSGGTFGLGSQEIESLRRFFALLDRWEREEERDVAGNQS